MDDIIQCAKSDAASPPEYRVMTAAAPVAPKTYPFNAVNRGVYIADNLAFLRAINDESVDLVTIDPPFAKNETFTADKLKPALSKGEIDNERRLLGEWGIRSAADAAKCEIAWPYGGRMRGGYKDIWSWEGDVHEDWIGSLEDRFPSVNKLIDATRYVHSESTAAYLCYMAIRLVEIHRVLKPTGSLFLHCDHTANGYLRQLLDGVFGYRNFRNEISFLRRQEKHNLARRRLGNIHDTIFWYAKSERAKYNIQYQPYDAEYVEKGYDKSDSRGRYQTFPCTNESGGNKPYEFRGMTRAWRFEPKRMEEMYHAGLLVQAKPGSPFRYKKYLEDAEGVKLQDIWSDIRAARGKEKTGYPTQKPVALAERIIAAATNRGDVVLDCFAGCAYSAIAAERLERQWAACDLNPRAWTVFKRQFIKTELLNPPLYCDDATTGQQVLPSDRKATVHGPRQLPVLQSPVSDRRPKDLNLPERKFKVPASIIPEAEMLLELLKLSDYKAWCCGFANRRPDGRIIETTRNFHLDHIAPKSKENTGTSNDIQNRAPMCPYHNIRKNNRRVALAEYRQEIADAGELMVDTINDLINLDWAQAQAMRIYGQAYARKNPMGV